MTWLLRVTSPCNSLPLPRGAPLAANRKGWAEGWTMGKYTWKSLYFLPGNEPSLPHMCLTMEDRNSLQISPYEPAPVARWVLPILYLLSPHLSPPLAPPDPSPFPIPALTPSP